MSTRFAVATYNTQFSIHSKEIRKDIVTMAQKGVSLFCLQEIVRYKNQKFLLETLLDDLGPNWEAIFNLGEENSILGMGNCIIWNKQSLRFEGEQKLLLPWSKHFSFHELIFSLLAGGASIPFRRRVIIGKFRVNGENVRVTNLHLDHNGGLKNRQRQLEYLLSILNNKEGYDHEIICGDFNTLDLLRKGTEYKNHEEIIGSEFKDVSKNVGWTADLRGTKLKYGLVINLFMRYIHIRRKLDFIWVKNFKKVKCETLPLNASDHKPLIAYLEF